MAPSDDLLPPLRPRSPLVRAGLLVAGVALVVVGIALGPVPVVPGFPLVIAGVLLIAGASAAARRGVNRLHRWLPEKLKRALRRATGGRGSSGTVSDTVADMELPLPPSQASGASSLATPRPDALDPADRAYLARRFDGAPLLFGAISVLTAPIILGMIPGALGLRAGADLWRTHAEVGTHRRWLVATGIVASFLGTAASIGMALLWGALLAGVLLGRDAMRETERWRGQTVPLEAIEVVEPGGAKATLAPVLKPSAGTSPGVAIGVGADRRAVERTVLLFIGVGAAPCAEALESIGPVVAEHPTARLVVVGPASPIAEVDAFARLHGVEAACIGMDAVLPPPLAHVAAFPTIVVVDPEGLIEFALVGARSADEYRRLVSGEAARAAKTADEAKRLAPPGGEQ